MSLSSNDIQAVYKAISENQRILVVPHANVDPDGISSALACYTVLQQLGKDVTVICPDTKPESLEFLPGFEKLEQEVKGSRQFVITINLAQGVEVDKLNYTVEDSKVNIIVVPKNGTISSQNVSTGDGKHPYDLIVVVDTADVALLGSFYTDNIDLFSSVPVINIDHHISNTKYGHIQMINPNAASATEVLYEWFMQVPELRECMTPDIATLLLTGLITDTRSFQNPNTTPRSLEVAAELLERGARQQEIVQNIYKTKPLSTLKIWGRALNRIQIDASARIVWSAISKEDLAEMEASSKETHGILDELISTIPDADVHVLFTEMEEGGLKASVRSSPAIDASALAGQAYGGGGHPRAAGFRVQKFDNFQLQVLECVQKLKDGITAQINKNTQEPPTPQMQMKQEAPVVSSSSPAPAAVPPQSPAKDVVGEIGESDQNKKGGTDVVEGLTS